MIPFAFDEAGQFGNGLAPVKVGKRTGFLNKAGHFSFDLPFRYASGFLTEDEESYTLVAMTDVSRFWTDDQKFGYVDSSGKVIWGPIEGSPDQPPFFGWSEEAKTQSCEGISDAVRRIISGFASP